MFERVIELDTKDATANYYLGLIYMLGLGVEPNAYTALQYLEAAGNEDFRALNARGVIMYIAPDPFETDPVKLSGFGPIRRMRDEAIRILEEAERLGCLNAVYNLGAIHLDDTDNDKFSFSKAYEKFVKAAQTGHALAAYNVAVMNMAGLGTYKSIKLANAFLKHVVNVGEFAHDLARAYELVEQGKHREALFIYLEQAEMG